ncbi:hypothetical protein OROGR_016023 [Orobanche gracilis]
MARSLLTCTPNLPLMLICFLYAQISTGTATATATAGGPVSNEFIKASCNVTLYQELCVASLTPYASIIQESHRKLAFTALAVSVKSGKSMKEYVGQLAKTSGPKAKEYPALTDCMTEVDEGVDRMTKSLKELKYSGPDFKLHLSNLQTWVSAALTDETTCTDGFSGRALNGTTKNCIIQEMTKVTQATSNALALCNTLG